MQPTAVCALLAAVLGLGWAGECGRSGQGRMAQLWGDALDHTDCTGPDGKPYPKEAVDALVRSMGPKRRGRKLFATKDPRDVRAELLSQYAVLQHGMQHLEVRHRTARAVKTNVTTTAKPKVKATTKASVKTTMKPGKKPAAATKATPKPAMKVTTAAPAEATEEADAASCGGTPARLCRTRYNTTAPMYGVSLTSGKPVTIVQKFPDLLQQVIFEVCESSQCDVLHGECVQTYTPHLFLVIPLGPVTLTGQDYVLVESGCVCRPKYTQQDTALPLDSFSGR